MSKERIGDELTLEEVKERVRDIPITLIIPPSPFLADERVFPSLGPLKLAAALEKNGNRTEVLDLSGFTNFEDVVKDYLSQTQVCIFGLTATTPQIPSAVRVLKVIKEYVSDSTVILGGPHVTLCNTAMVEDVKRNGGGRGLGAFKQLTDLFDKLVIGDGEMAIFSSMDPKNTDQIVDAGNLQSSLYIQKGTLEEFPNPARHLIDIDSYCYQIDKKRAFSVIGQLGCPYECGFCGGRASHTFRVARTRSPESVIGEIENVVRQSEGTGNPFRAVMFYDDELNILPSGLESLCKGLIGLQERLGIEMAFRGFVKTERFTSEQARLMYQAGFRVLLSGIESASDSILLAMGKRARREDNTRFIETAHNAGLKVKALMSLGHPGESEQTIRESILWVLENKPDDIDWSIITEYPGSPYFDNSEHDDKVGAWVYKAVNGERLWSMNVDYTKEVECYKGVPGNYQAYVWTDYLSGSHLVQLRDEAEKITRTSLNLPPISTLIAKQFEHSMGQGPIPGHILRVSRINP